ncbi:MAG: hypothetical protein ACXAD7_01910 [Candidatus Kariarchaeaceae archaeon]|jgi:hypothetical protein
MAVYDFLVDEPVFDIVLIAVGAVGILLGIDRTLESDEEESSILQIAGPLAAVGLYAVLILAAFDDSIDKTNYTYLFGMLLGISLIAKPFRKLPIAFAFAVIAFLGLFYYAYTNSDEEGEILAGIEMKWIIAGIIGIVLIIFIIGFVQEQIMDFLLYIMGWGPYVFVLSVIVIAQGISLLINQPDKDGILGWLPG